jgi:hypothetical protein
MPIGLAVFDELVLNTAATGYQLIFDADYLGLSKYLIRCIYRYPSRCPDAIEHNPTTIGYRCWLGNSWSTIVRITDEFGNVISGVSVSVTETGGLCV